jgi:hypothetical protein
VLVPIFFVVLSQVNDQPARAAMLSAGRRERETLSAFERACFVTVMTNLVILVVASVAFLVL